MPKRLEDCHAALDVANKQFETAKLECKKDFPHEKELAEKLQRLTALDALLNMDKCEPQAVDMPAEDQDVSKRRNRDWER